MHKIILIEDETILRENICEILELNNYTVIEAENGYEGIQKIFKEEPSIVICDIMMPELDGYSVLKTIRDSKMFANLPFIFLTARSSHMDSRSGMEMGADDYISKPFEIKDLLNTIKARLERTEGLKKEINDKVDAFKKTLSTVYTHEFYTGLTSIYMAADILIEHYHRMTSTHLTDLFFSIKTAAERIERTLRNLQLYAEFSGPNNNASKIKDSIKSAPCFYKDTLIEIANKFAISYKRPQDLKFRLVDCKLLLPVEHFSKIVEEIIDNAFKFSETGTEIYINSSFEDDECVISIANMGICCEELNKSEFPAFQQYFREIHEQQGNGLGLHIANRLITINNGEMIINSIRDSLTTVKLSFPK